MRLEDGSDDEPPRAGVVRSLRDVLDEAMNLHRGPDRGDDLEAMGQVLQGVRPFGRDAFDAAVALLSSDDAVERTVGCDVLAALCNPDEEHWGPEVASVVIRLAQGERDVEVLWSIVNALRFAEDARGLPTLADLAEHPDSGIRYQVAVALPSCEGGDAGLLARALIGLMDDPDEDVRDWATFGLGTLTGLDGRDVREALVCRLGDENVDARDEALVGLARRRDPRAVAALASRLGKREVGIGMLAVEAAAYVADERLLAPLQALTSWWDVDPELLEEALSACDPEQQARALAEQALLLSALEPPVRAWHGLSVGLCCERVEREVLVLIGEDGQAGSYDFTALVTNRAGGDLDAAVQAVLADLGRTAVRSPDQAARS